MNTLQREGKTIVSNMNKVKVTMQEFDQLMHLASIALDDSESMAARRLARAQYQAIIAAALNRTR